MALAGFVKNSIARLTTAVLTFETKTQSLLSGDVILQHTRQNITQPLASKYTQVCSWLATPPLKENPSAMSAKATLTQGSKHAAMALYT